MGILEFFFLFSVQIQNFLKVIFKKVDNVKSHWLEGYMYILIDNIEI